MNEKTLRVLEYPKIIQMLEDKATSTVGKALCKALMPSTDVEAIDAMQAETDEATTLIIKQGRPPIGPIYDLEDAVKLAKIGGVLNPKQLIEIGDALRTARILKRFLQAGEHYEAAYPALYALGGQLTQLKTLESEIERCIVSETEIADDASPELRKIRQQIEKKNLAVRQKLESMITNPDYQKYLQDTLVTIRQDRFVLPVKSEHKNHVKGLVHDQSAKGSTFYIEPIAVVELNNALRELKISERQEIERILRMLTERVAAYTSEIEVNLKVLTQIDFVFAKGKLAVEMNAVRPELSKDRQLRIKNGRHPLLPKETVVPTNIWLGEQFTTLLITGPNTGGKTVTLKTVGLLTLMTQAGLHVPAGYGTKMAVFDQVFADIGDEQSIEQSLSTFSSHMTNIVNILNDVSDNALVLFDELGAGTDPTEGAALAMAILDELRQFGIRTLATTHYAELKTYAISEDGVENACMEFDVASLSPTYRLLIGIPGKSNAFEISRKLGLSSHLIEKSKAYIHTDDIAFEDVVERIENSRKIAEAERDEAIRLKLEAERLKKALADKESKWLEKRDSLLKKSKEEAREILREAKETSENILRELRSIDRNSLKQKNKEIEAMRRRLQEQLEETTDGVISNDVESELPPENLNVGDVVRVLSLGQDGTVAEPPNDKGEVLVQVGLMKMSVSIKKLLLVNKQKRDQQVYKKHAEKRQTSAYIQTEIDVRGENIEDAMVIIDKYLDDAALSSLEKVRIIHGKGTGALRKGLHEHFKRHPHVKAFEFAAYNEGGNGATVITLK
ncbi:endonuclease MutS2 [Fusibacter sp. JL298sf-3]